MEPPLLRAVSGETRLQFEDDCFAQALATCIRARLSVSLWSTLRDRHLVQMQAFTHKEPKGKPTFDDLCAELRTLGHEYVRWHVYHSNYKQSASAARDEIARAREEGAGGAAARDDRAARRNLPQMSAVALEPLRRFAFRTFRGTYSTSVGDSTVGAAYLRENWQMRLEFGSLLGQLFPQYDLDSGLIITARSTEEEWDDLSLYQNSVPDRAESRLYPYMNREQRLYLRRRYVNGYRFQIGAAQWTVIQPPASETTEDAAEEVRGRVYLQKVNNEGVKLWSTMLFLAEREGLLEESLDSDLPGTPFKSESRMSKDLYDPWSYPFGHSMVVCGSYPNLPGQASDDSDSDTDMLEHEHTPTRLLVKNTWGGSGFFWMSTSALPRRQFAKLSVVQFTARIPVRRRRLEELLGAMRF